MSVYSYYLKSHDVEFISKIYPRVAQVESFLLKNMEKDGLIPSDYRFIYKF